MRPVDVNCDARRKSSLSQSWSPAVRTLRRTADPGNELERGSRHSGVAPGSKSSSPAGRSVQRPPAALVPWNPRMRPTGCFVLRLTLWLRVILSRRGGSCGSACGLAPLASTPAHRTQDSTHVLTPLGDGWVGFAHALPQRRLAADRGLRWRCTSPTWNSSWPGDVARLL